MLDIRMQNVETIQLSFKDVRCYYVNFESFRHDEEKNHVLIAIKELLKMNPMRRLLLYEEKHSQLDMSIDTMGSHGISSRPWRSIQLSTLIKPSR